MLQLMGDEVFCCSDCNVVKDSTGDTDHPQMTSKAVAAVYCGMRCPAGHPGLEHGLWHVMKHTLI